MPIIMNSIVLGHGIDEISDLKQLAEKVRGGFEKKIVDRNLLDVLYTRYNRVPNINKFLEISEAIFPKLNCGIACVYIKHLLKKGEIINGEYAGNEHTFLKVEENIIDVTADQYGGPSVYVGPLVRPWLYKNKKQGLCFL